MRAEDLAYVVSLVRTIPGFPNPAITFRDFLPVLADARGLSILLDALVAALPVSPDEIDSIAGLEARGFLIGPMLAARLDKGFIAIRKAGKLPPATMSQSYTLEYGQASIEIEQQCVQPGQRVLIVDDLIATGGTAQAAAQLIERSQAVVAGFSFVMELKGLTGMQQLSAYPCSSLLTMPA